MNIEELKKSIENKSVEDKLIIFKISEHDFIPTQYVNAISEYKHLKLEYIENLDTLMSPKINIFEEVITENTLKLYRVEELDLHDFRLYSVPNLCIFCKKVTPETESLFKDYIVEIPKLQSWQIRDYVYSLAEGVEESKLDELINLCKSNIYRLDNELCKLTIFSPKERTSMYENFVQDGVFNDLSQYTIFSLTDCIIKKNIPTLTQVYKELDKIDVEPIGLVTLLLNNFKNIISIQLGNNPSAETLGMSKGQFWAIKYSCGFYTKNQLLKIFKLLSSIDKKIKLGEMPVDILVDYLITHILIIGGQI